MGTGMRRWITAALAVGLLSCGAGRPGQLLRGHLASGKFTPCGGGTAIPIDEAISPEFGYIEATGEIDNGRLKITELRRALPEGDGCSQQLDFQYRAQGNEPFWNLTVAAGGTVLNQMDAGERRFPPGSDEIDVDLKPTRCTDSMSGAVFHLTATVRVDGRELHGCAYAGEQ